MANIAGSIVMKGESMMAQTHERRLNAENGVSLTTYTIDGLHIITIHDPDARTPTRIPDSPAIQLMSKQGRVCLSQNVLRLLLPLLTDFAATGMLPDDITSDSV